MLQWKVAPKVISCLLVLCFSISLVTGWISYQNGKRALEEFSFNQLTAIRVIKAQYKTELRGEITVKGAGQFKTYMLQEAAEAKA